MIFRAASRDDIRWFEAEVGAFLTENSNGIVAEENGKIIGMIALDDWTPNSVHIHFYESDVRALPLLWKELMCYIRLHGRKLIYAVTPTNRELSLRLQRALGFQTVHVIKDGWADGVDLVLNELRVLNDGHGKQQVAA